jgi:hypothetical protein
MSHIIIRSNGGVFAKSKPIVKTKGKTVTSKRNNIVLPDHFFTKKKTRFTNHICKREDNCEKCKEYINNAN